MHTYIMKLKPSVFVFNIYSFLKTILCDYNKKSTDIINDIIENAKWILRLKSCSFGFFYVCGENSKTYQALRYPIFVLIVYKNCKFYYRLKFKYNTRPIFLRLQC